MINDNVYNYASEFARKYMKFICSKCVINSLYVDPGSLSIDIFNSVNLLNPNNNLKSCCKIDSNRLYLVEIYNNPKTLLYTNSVDYFASQSIVEIKPLTNIARSIINKNLNNNRINHELFCLRYIFDHNHILSKHFVINSLIPTDAIYDIIRNMCFGKTYHNSSVILPYFIKSFGTMFERNISRIVCEYLITTKYLTKKEYRFYFMKKN